MIKSTFSYIKNSSINSHKNATGCRGSVGRRGEHWGRAKRDGEGRGWGRGGWGWAGLKCKGKWGRQRGGGGWGRGGVGLRV